MVIADPIQVKQIEKQLNRKLTFSEINGLKKIKVKDKWVRINQVHILSLHLTNSCK